MLWWVKQTRFDIKKTDLTDSTRVNMHSWKWGGTIYCMLIQLKKKMKQWSYAEKSKVEKIWKIVIYNVMLKPGSNVQKYFKAKLENIASFYIFCLTLNIKTFKVWKRESSWFFIAVSDIKNNNCWSFNSRIYKEKNKTKKKIDQYQKGSDDGSETSCSNFLPQNINQTFQPEGRNSDTSTNNRNKAEQRQ